MPDLPQLLVVTFLSLPADWMLAPGKTTSG